MKTIFALATIMFLGSSINAQSLATQSIGSCGYVPISTNSPTLHWNVGEVAIGLVGNSDKLNQGLYQVIDFSTAVQDPSFNHNLMTLWPNPTEGRVYVKHDLEEGSRLSIYNTGGQLLSRFEELHGERELDISAYRPATYYFLIENTRGLKQIIPVVKL